MHPASRTLRIGIDAHALGSRLGGNESYLRGVLAGLREFPQHRYVAYVTDALAAEEALALLPAAETRLLGHGGAVQRLGWWLPRLVRRDRVDVLHTQYVAPPFSPPIVVMIHDLSFRHHREWYSAAERRRFELTVPWTARRARRILTVSEYSRQDIIAQLGVDPAKVRVTYNRIPDHFAPASEAAIAATATRYGLRRPYVLAVGNLQPRKNLPRLIEAWESLRAQHEDFTAQLVIVGKKAWLFDEILRSTASSRFASDIVLTDFVPEPELPALYSGAALFVYPSLFEGFGLPPLEAMACGVPVIVGNTSSLPEVCGEAAEYADPMDTSSLATAMLRLFRDPTLQRERSARGLDQAERFRTNDLAAGTVAAYEEAASFRPAT